MDCCLIVLDNVGLFLFVKQLAMWNSDFTSGLDFFHLYR